MIRRRLSIACVLLVALAPAARAQGQTQGSIGIRLADAPTDRKDDPRAHTYIVDHLHQGTTITRHVEVQSTVQQPTTVQLYAAAADLEDGQFSFGEGHAQNDLTDWTTIDPPSVTVPANGAVQAAVTIAVPTNATDGERYAVVWAELPGSGGQANQVNRVGVRIYLSVGEGTEPKTDFTIDALTAKRDRDGTPIIETTVTNTGGRAIDLSGSLQLNNGPGSLAAGPFDVKVGTTLAPGATAPASVRLDKNLPDGPWDAVVTISAGRLSHEAKGRITFPSTPGATAEPVKANSAEGQRKVLLPLALALVVVVAAPTVALWRRRMLATVATRA